MKSETIDYINIGLLIISFVAAIHLPFELFLFSYAFLGPLHYLTEINWLDDKKYFIKAKTKIYKIFIVLASVIAVYPLLKYIDNDFFNFISSQKHIIITIGFLFSLSLILFSKSKQLILAFIVSILLSVICLLLLPKIIMVLGIFLPTLIHVYIFTLLFMIYGQLKCYTKAGITSIVLLIMAPIVLFFIDIVPKSYEISEFVQQTFLRSGFLSINTIVADFFTDINRDTINLMSPVVLKIQIFIAFAYTYHYLNWFSKTSIIGWKSSLSNKRAKYIIVIWLGSVGIYLYDYITGLTVLFFLSLLHVILEFPLNVVTIKEIVSASLKRLPKMNKS
ncbi:hypothetical protein [Winogradskyella luteola]|uniref:Uncharacterized protein n=1 Tax=Winogradskyella luteola TaxID=2828330 RepID=A0A9X1JRI3_9FLAO|nr:hypothetical protein [Winogradskyella luteola]MBV7269933.1 hypothetical protein [Winogradskyella luteola]